MEGLVVAVVIFIGLFIVVLLWQLARSIYYWTAAKIYGWSEEVRDMTRDAIRPGELPKEPLQPVSAALDIGISLRVGAFEIAMRHQPRTAMTWADDINHVQIVFFDQPVQVYVNEVEPSGGAPMPE